MQKAIEQIKADLKQRLDEFNRAGRCSRPSGSSSARTFDIEMMETTGACAGIENYSRYLTGRKARRATAHPVRVPPREFAADLDESHVTVPQIGGMFRGDFNRKSVLSEYGFRLPSCIDNRPLKFEEWDALRPQTTYVSPRPAPGRWSSTGGTFVEQVIRPTGLIDPPCSSARPSSRSTT
jgi:excinuclease ABC subunit B